MNYVDIAILLILAGFLLKGLLRGLLRELCSLAGLVVGGYLAFTFHGPLAESLLQSFKWPAQLCVVATFLALFLATVIFFSLLGYLLSRFVKLLFLGGLNRVAGALFGLLQGTLLLIVVLYGLSVGPMPKALKSAMAASELAPPFVDMGKTVFSGELVKKG